MRKNVTVWCVLMWLSPTENFRTQEMGLLTGRAVFGVTTSQVTTGTLETETTTVTDASKVFDIVTSDVLHVSTSRSSLLDNVSIRY